MRARLENRPKITSRGLSERAVRRIVGFFTPGGNSASILVVSRRLRAPPGTLFASLGRPWGAFGRSRAAFGPPSGRAGDAPRRSTDQSRPKIARRGLRETIRDDFRAIWGRFGWRFPSFFDAARRLDPPRADLEYTPPCASGLRCALCAHDAKINRKSLREAFPSEPCEE